MQFKIQPSEARSQNSKFKIQNTPAPLPPIPLTPPPIHPHTPPPMTRKIINTDQAPAPVGPYNQAVVASGQLMFVAGQIPLDPATGELVGGDDVAAQTEQAISNLKAILAAGGATLDNVVKTSVFLKDMNDFATVNGVYAQQFGDTDAPARACVEVARLPKDVRVEIECIAVL
jgi:2-iminobutanoate/2-iminopropanoate deaminase